MMSKYTLSSFAGKQTQPGAIRSHCVWGDSTGNMFVVDSKGKQVRKIETSNGVNNMHSNLKDLKDVDFMWGDSLGNLFANQAKESTIITIDSNGKHSVFADEKKLSNQYHTRGLWGDSLGSLYFVAASISTKISAEIRKIDKFGVLSTVAGGSGEAFQRADDDMVGELPVTMFPPQQRPALGTFLNEPYALTGDSNNRLYVSSRVLSSVTVVHLSTGLVSEIQTPRYLFFTHDFSPTHPYAVSLWADTANNLFVGMTNSCILKMPSPDYVGVIVAGNVSRADTRGACDPALAKLRGISPAEGMWGDSAGDLYLAMPQFNAVHKLSVGSSNSVTVPESVYLRGAHHTAVVPTNLPTLHPYTFSVHRELRSVAVAAEGQDNAENFAFFENKIVVIVFIVGLLAVLKSLTSMRRQKTYFRV